MKKILNCLKKYREILSFLFWGIMTTVVSWGSYSVFVFYFPKQIGSFEMFGLELSITILLSNVLSWICAVVFAFFTNKIWVFESKSWKGKVWLSELGKFVSARLFTGILEIIVVPVLVAVGLNSTIMGVEGMFAKVFVSVVVVVLNYILGKIFVFK